MTPEAILPYGEPWGSTLPTVAACNHALPMLFLNLTILACSQGRKKYNKSSPGLRDADFLQHATRQRCASVLVAPSEALCLGVYRPYVVTAHGTDVTFLWSGMLPKHEHGFPAFFVELLEQNQRPLVQPQTTLLITVDNIQSILPPVCCNVVFLERNGKDFVTRVIDGNAE